MAHFCSGRMLVSCHCLCLELLTFSVAFLTWRLHNVNDADVACALPDTAELTLGLSLNGYWPGYSTLSRALHRYLRAAWRPREQGAGGHWLRLSSHTRARSSALSVLSAARSPIFPKEQLAAQLHLGLGQLDRRRSTRAAFATDSAAKVSRALVTELVSRKGPRTRPCNKGPLRLAPPASLGTMLPLPGAVIVLLAAMTSGAQVRKRCKRQVKRRSPCCPLCCFMLPFKRLPYVVGREEAGWVSPWAVQERRSRGRSCS